MGLLEDDDLHTEVDGQTLIPPENQNSNDLNRDTHAAPGPRLLEPGAFSDSGCLMADLHWLNS